MRRRIMLISFYGKKRANSRQRTADSRQGALHKGRHDIAAGDPVSFTPTFRLGIISQIKLRKPLKWFTVALEYGHPQPQGWVNQTKASKRSTDFLCKA